MASRRRERLNEVIRREVSAKLLADVKDPRVGFVTVLRAELHDDFSSANVFVTVFEEEKKKETLKALNKMRGFFQNGLSETLGIRLTPVLTFKFDEAANKAYSLDSLISKARESDMDHIQTSSDASEEKIESEKMESESKEIKEVRSKDLDSEGLVTGDESQKQED